VAPGGDTDLLQYRTTAQPGDCISQRKATCNGLTGQDRKTCNHAQIGVCQATFNVPSAHAR
jgi:hypothetical protein